MQIAPVGALVVKTYTGGEMESYAGEKENTRRWQCLRYWKSREEIITLRTMEVTSEEWPCKRSSGFST